MPLKNYKPIQENSKSIIIESLEQFRKIFEDIKTTDSNITFNNIKIDKEFKELFWSLFLDGGIKNFEFKNCQVVELEPIYVSSDIKIGSIEQFQKLSITDVQNMESISFNNMVVNDEFRDKFWELFLDSGLENIKKLEFKNCQLEKGVKYSELISSNGFTIGDLTISNCGLTIKDAKETLLLVNPYALNSVNFFGNGFNREDPEFKDLLETRVNGRLCLEDPYLGV